MHENGLFPLGSTPSKSEEMALISRLTPLTLCGSRESALFVLDCIGFQYCVQTLPGFICCVYLSITRDYMYMEVELSCLKSFLVKLFV